MAALHRIIFFSLIVVNLACQSLSRGVLQKGHDDSGPSGPTCTCDDLKCMEDRVEEYNEEVKSCLIGAGIEIFVPGHGKTLAAFGKCALTTGMTVNSVIGRIKACKMKPLQDQSATDITNILAHCLFGNAVNASVLTQQILECAGHEAGSAALECGWTVANGALTLGNNAVCLANDIANAQKSKAALAEMLKKYADSPSPRDTTKYENVKCNDEDISCTAWGMRKWGVWLAKNQALCKDNENAKKGKANCCAVYCGNGAPGLKACRENFGKWATDSTDDACIQMCSTAQCSNTIDLCMSYCCDQDATCTRDAQKFKGLGN